MAYNKAKEERKWRIWKEAEETQMRSLLTRLGTVGKKTVNKVYDPACGSGSLLLKAEKVLGKEAVMNGFFGQEINITTYNLCRINMFLHDIGFDKFDIECEDTLTNPQHWHRVDAELQRLLLWL